jgi:hypothetical protein
MPKATMLAFTQALRTAARARSTRLRAAHAGHGTTIGCVAGGGIYRELVTIEVDQPVAKP